MIVFVGCVSSSDLCGEHHGQVVKACKGSERSRKEPSSAALVELSAGEPGSALVFTLLP